MFFFPKKWLFDLKNLGSFVVQKAGKFGRLQVTRLQIYYGRTQAETTLFSFEELRTFRLADDQISVPFATQRTPNFRNETTTFLEKRPQIWVPP